MSREQDKSDGTTTQASLLWVTLMECEGLNFRPFHPNKKLNVMPDHAGQGPALGKLLFNFLSEGSLTCSINFVFCHSDRQQ